MSVVATAGAFLADRFAALVPEETIEIRTFGPDGRPGPRDWFADTDQAAAFAARLAPRLHIYYGACPHRRGGGRKVDVLTVPALWADVDDKRFLTGRAGALAALASFPLPPTWTIDSGGGLQPYWQLTAPLAVAEDLAAVARVERLLCRLYARLGGLDAVQDLSRVLRVPGSLNGKYDPPRPVVVLHHHPGAAYELADFERELPAPPDPAPTPRCPPAPGAPGRVRLHAGIPSPDEVRDLLRHIPPRGDYREHWITILAAVHSLYPGHEGVALCEEWSPGHAGEVAAKFASFGRYQGAQGAAGAGTLYFHARRHGWRPAPAARSTLHGLRARRVRGLRVRPAEGVRRAGA